MKYLRTRVALGIGLIGVVALFTGCATVPTEYDGDPIAAMPDGTTLVRLTIQNNRTQDALDPHFYLLGTGRHPLGIVHGMGGTKSQFVDTSWFGADGCMVVIAHYVGLGDWTSTRFCWRTGNVIDVSLQSIMSTSTAWAHP